MKVLLVEDNERVTRFVTRGLREAAHPVDHADNGRDGMFLTVSERYDTIIMDRMLPGQIDGLAIIGGLAVSHLLSLFTTPVIYLAFDRTALSLRRRFGGPRPAPAPAE